MDFFPFAHFVTILNPESFLFCLRALSPLFLQVLLAPTISYLSSQSLLPAPRTSVLPGNHHKHQFSGTTHPRPESETPRGWSQQSALTLGDPCSSYWSLSASDTGCHTLDSGKLWGPPEPSTKMFPRHLHHLSY